MNIHAAVTIALIASLQLFTAEARAQLAGPQLAEEAMFDVGSIPAESKVLKTGLLCVRGKSAFAASLTLNAALKRKTVNVLSSESSTVTPQNNFFIQPFDVSAAMAIPVPNSQLIELCVTLTKR